MKEESASEKNGYAQPYNLKTVFYRVSVLEGDFWIVKDAGLTKNQAERKVQSYKSQGCFARSLCCKKKKLAPIGAD